MTTTSGTGALAGRREWVGLIVLAFPTLLLSLDMSVLYLALPQLTGDLGAGATQQLWIMDIYGFMIAGFLVTMGTLGDRIGRRRLLMFGASAFGVASVLAAYSTSPEMLIATRALLGIAGATLMPSTLALISNMFRNARQRASAIGVWMSCFMGGMTVGPLVGGILLENFWWGSAFLLGVPVMVILLVAAPFLLPEYRDTSAGRIDLTSVALSLAAILPVVYGIKELAKHGWSAAAVVAIVAGVAVGAAFVHRQRRLEHPLLDLRLFANRTFASALTIQLGGGIIMGGTFLFVTLYLQMVVGLSPLEAGLWLIPPNLAMVAGFVSAPILARRFRPARVMAGGLVLAAIGYVLLTQVGVVGGRPVLIAGFVLATVGIALPTALVTDLVVGSAPPEKAGSAASISETGGELGIALGVATLGSLGAAVYRGQVGESIGADVPGAAADSARESLEGAINAAAQLPPAAGAELLDLARTAYTTALNSVALLGAGLFLILAVLAGVLLRTVRPIGEGETERAAREDGDVASAGSEHGDDLVAAAPSR